MNSDWVNPDLRGHRHHHLQPHQQHDQHQQSRQLSSNMTHTISFENVANNNNIESTNQNYAVSDPTCNSSGNKSTRGASKMRRDLINNEIVKLRDLLPLPSTTRQRLSQLQLMALVLVYVRKCNYFDQVYKMAGRETCRFNSPSIGFSKALNGFLMMATQTGKLLYISDNAAEYLGHSMEDLLIHGDSVYDIIDKQDHAAIQSELMKGLQQISNDPISRESGDTSTLEKRLFLCRMNVSRNARRQMRFGDQKIVLMEGKFSGVLPLCSRNESVFLSWCTPIAMPETRECVVQGATNIFTSNHSMDFKITSIDDNGEYYLGYSRYDLEGTSWYNLLHPDCIKEVQSKHRLITQSETEKSCILLQRLQRQDGEWIWTHTVLQVKESVDTSQSPMIVCTNQVLSEREATVMKSNGWLYHYYMVQSRLQYNLTYGGQQSSSSLPNLYSQTQFSTSPNFEEPPPTFSHPFSCTPLSTPLQGYPPPFGYTSTGLQYNHEHIGHLNGSNNGRLKEPSSESPLDYSSASSGSFSDWHEDSLNQSNIKHQQFQLDDPKIKGNVPPSPDYGY